VTFTEFDSRFKKHVAGLPYERQLDLGLDICKKLFFDYQHFCDENDWGKPDVLLDAINLIELSKTQPPTKTLLTASLKKVEEVTPDTEDFGEANYALNACVAVCYTLQFLLESNQPEYIYHVGKSYYDSIDARVQGDDDLSNDQIDAHLTMIEARRYLLQ
jgi:uncharacterized protein